jgi:hypothetical protein
MMTGSAAREAERERDFDLDLDFDLGFERDDAFETLKADLATEDFDWGLLYPLNEETFFSSAG